MRCPAELYRDSSRRYRAAEVQLSYPGMATRLVDKNGKLSWKKQKVFLTGSLAGWQVGLKGLKRANWRSGLADSCSDTLIPRRSISSGPRRRHEPTQPSWAKGSPGGSLESSGRNSRLTHNRLFPGRRAAAT